jgi:hypothetical protein
MEDFKYLGTTLTNQNYIQECLLSFGTELFSSLFSKCMKIKLYSTIILPVVLHECEIWLPTLREVLRLRVFDSTVLRRIDLRGTM